MVARNSHSFGIVSDALRSKSYLVIYGGASPEHGPLGDTLYAEIPVDPSTIGNDCNTVSPDYLVLHHFNDTLLTDSKSFFVKWELLKIPSTAAVFMGSMMGASQPGAREMHGTCSIDGAMLISGGRNDRGLLSDVWILQSNNDVDSSEMIAALEPSDGYAGHSSDRMPLLWRRCSDLELSRGLCSHGASILAMPHEVDSVISTNTSPSVNSTDLSDIVDGNNDTVPKHDRYALVVTGGFSGDGISDTVMVIDLRGDLTRSRASPAVVANRCQWTSLDLDARLEGRFGSAVCCLSRRTCQQLVNNPKYTPVFNATLKSRFDESVIIESTSIECDATRGRWSDSSPVAALIFGGVCIEKDFGDLHLLLL